MLPQMLKDSLSFKLVRLPSGGLTLLPLDVVSRALPATRFLDALVAKYGHASSTKEAAYSIGGEICAAYCTNVGISC